MKQTTLTIGGANGSLVSLFGRMGNRHGLIAGATGTGKTVTLQTLAEGFSRMGTPVFAVDVKGDLSGIAAAGAPHPKIDERLASIPLPEYTAPRCQFCPQSIQRRAKSCPQGNLFTVHFGLGRHHRNDARHAVFERKDRRTRRPKIDTA